MQTSLSAPPSGDGKKPKLTLKRIAELQKILEKADAEIDNIIQDYYVMPGGQNVAGGIGAISRLHAHLVEDLAGRKRELMKEERKGKKK